MTKPCDTCWQAFKRDMLAGKLDPVGDDLVVGKHFQQHIINLGDVAFFTRSRHPAERTNRAGKEWT
ncbi:hypothetical protein D3C80_1140830 [compost metagenome]